MKYYNVLYKDADGVNGYMVLSGNSESKVREYFENEYPSCTIINIAEDTE